ncbi:GNAT family N-acetyltransferase [soil metagenome]
MTEVIDDGSTAGAAPVSVRLRPTMLSDLDFVLTVEHDPDHIAYITPWERPQHEGAVRFPDFRHFIIEVATDSPAANAGGGMANGTEAVGFVILQGCRNHHRSIELKRMVVQTKGRGIGRQCIRLLKRMAFQDLHAHRFWLDVKGLNVRAKALYDSEGFIVEGVLRDAVMVDGGFDSLIVMSLLETEYPQNPR